MQACAWASGHSQHGKQSSQGRVCVCVCVCRVPHVHARSSTGSTLTRPALHPSPACTASTAQQQPTAGARQQASAHKTNTALGCPRVHQEARRTNVRCATLFPRLRLRLCATHSRRTPASKQAATRPILPRQPSRPSTPTQQASKVRRAQRRAHTWAKPPPPQAAVLGGRSQRAPRARLVRRGAAAALPALTRGSQRRRKDMQHTTLAHMRAAAGHKQRAAPRGGPTGA
jgi:hypothetical protein